MSSANTGPYPWSITLSASGGDGYWRPLSYNVHQRHGIWLCRHPGGALTATSAGTCTVTATKATDGHYLAITSANQIVTFSKRLSGHLDACPPRRGHLPVVDHLGQRPVGRAPAPSPTRSLTVRPPAAPYPGRRPHRDYRRHLHGHGHQGSGWRLPRDHFDEPDRDLHQGHIRPLSRCPRPPRTPIPGQLPWPLPVDNGSGTVTYAVVERHGYRLRRPRRVS